MAARGGKQHIPHVLLATAAGASSSFCPQAIDGEDQSISRADLVIIWGLVQDALVAFELGDYRAFLGCMRRADDVTLGDQAARPAVHFPPNCSHSRTQHADASPPPPPPLPTTSATSSSSSSSPRSSCRVTSSWVVLVRCLLHELLPEVRRHALACLNKAFRANEWVPLDDVTHILAFRSSAAAGRVCASIGLPLKYPEQASRGGTGGSFEGETIASALPVPTHVRFHTAPSLGFDPGFCWGRDDHLVLPQRCESCSVLASGDSYFDEERDCIPPVDCALARLYQATDLGGQFSAV